MPYGSNANRTSDANIDKWAGNTYIFKVDERIPKQLFCQGKIYASVEVSDDERM